MKAYVLKVTIKNTHPPIWRRIVVPAGISFSQLNLILNTAIGWCGYHLSSYEFKNYYVNIVDDPDEFGFGWGPNEYIDAANTCIDDYLDDEDIKSFTYTYDFGDDWTHTVQIEKRLDDYSGPCPTVTKYKGDTPWEDCGGVWGFYNYLEILNNPQHEEFNEINEWTGGELPEYDMEFVNDELSGIIMSKEKHPPMSTNEVYDAYFKEKKLYTIEFDMMNDGFIPYDTDDYNIYSEMIEEFSEADERIADVLSKKSINEEEKYEIHNILFNSNMNTILAMMINDKLSQKIIEIMGEEKAVSFMEEVNNSTINDMNRMIEIIMSGDD